MTILDGDIQLLKSERLTDFDNGGGLPTGIAVIDGGSNNLFADVAEMDRVFGNVSLRKVFPGVVTDNTDTYYGSNIIIAQPPADARVSATLFTTSSWSDERPAARDRLESYLAMGAEGRWMLYGNHLAGQRTLQMHCPSTVQTPAVDDVLALVKRADESVYQYVRISRMIERHVNVEFEDSKGTFYRDIITLELSDSLRYGFAAATMERFTPDWFAPPTKIHNTVAADAAEYYGVQPLKISAALGDLTVKVRSIYAQLVPSALAETPIVDTRCASDRELILAIAGAERMSFTVVVTGQVGTVFTRYFGSPFARGSLATVGNGLSLTDDGNGNLMRAGQVVGSVDYSIGSITWIMDVYWNGVTEFSAQPAVRVALPGHTTSTIISTTNRGYTYVKTLWPLPAPGTAVFSYMAQGKWYALYDDGAGGMSGDDGAGAGTINYSTGALVLTLGALPDAETQLLFSWGSPAHIDTHAGSSVVARPAIKATIGSGGLDAGTLSISYLAGGVTRTMTDTGTGEFSGAGSGWVDYGSGAFVVRPSYLPDSVADLQLSFKRGSAVTELFPAAGALTNIGLAHPAKPSSVALEFSDQAGVRYTLVDDGAGHLVLRSTDTAGAVAGWDSGSSTWGFGVSTGATSSVSVLSTTGIVGTINYAAGTIGLAASIQLQFFASRTTSIPGASADAWESKTGTVNAAGTMTVRYRQASDSAGDVETLSIAMPALQVDLLPSISNRMVPGAWRFTLGGATYVDRNGTLIKNPSNATNSGTLAGSIDYATGIATITDYTGGADPSISVVGATRRGDWIDYQIRFRTAGAPLQNASLYVAALRADNSTLLNGSGSSGGEIDGTLVGGTIDYTTGIAFVRFGQWVTAAGNEGQDWYDPDNVAGLQVWKPTYVLPESATYNAVVTSSLPLDADILGLDPVRLPVDGRVPIYRKGDAIVVHHTGTHGPINVSNGQTVQLPRERLAKIKVIGGNGATISAGYSQDLDLGTVTFNNVSGYSQPVTIEHRIEDSALVSDVQINGDLKIVRALTHDFPLGTYVSSVLYIGNLQARVSVLFDQQTWGNAWSDDLSGNAASGTYNDTLYPLELTNRGTLDERWAIVFTNTTMVNVIGESVGQIVTGHNITQDLSPINPAVGVPYFSMAAGGFGAGWAAGNVIRLNTHAANFPIWIARTVLQGPGTEAADKFIIGVRGDVDAA